MADSASIKGLTPRHDAILDFLLVNPHCPRWQMAQHFGVTETWLSIIIHSDVFQARYQEKNQEVFRETVVPLREKLLGVAHVAVDKLGDAIGASTDPEFLLAAADKTLHRLGYAPSKGPTPPPALVGQQQNNYYLVDATVLANARSRMLPAGTLPAPGEI